MRKRGVKKETKLRNWSLYIKNRDQYICQICGYKTNKKLIHAHHILQKSEHKKYIINKANGISVCIICHAKFLHKDFISYVLHKPSYITKKEWLEYLKEWKIIYDLSIARKGVTKVTKTTKKPMKKGTTKKGGC